MKNLINSNIIFYFVIILSNFFVMSALCQTDKSEQPMPIEETPSLTYKQMLEDMDSLTSYIKQISPIIYFNKQVRGIDFDEISNRLKKEITPTTTKLEFLQVIKKTMTAAQDGHSSLLFKSLLNYAKKDKDFLEGVKYDSIDIEYNLTYNKLLAETNEVKLDLNLVYSDGAYYNLQAFTFKEKSYPALMKLIQCNDINVHTYIEGCVEKISPLRWDDDNNRFYHEMFYATKQAFIDDTLNLDFEDETNLKHTIKFAIQDSVEIAKPAYAFDYNSKDKDQLTTHYFEKDSIAYVRLPFMEEAYADTIIDKLENYLNKFEVKSIVFDVRGNGGGSDYTFLKVFDRLLSDTLSFDLVVARNFSAFNQKYLEINRDSIALEPMYTFDAGVPKLNDQEMFFISIPGYEFVVPDSLNYGFEGNVYVLQDRFIYSSTTNLSVQVSHTEKLVSIGEIPNLLGGIQTAPIVVILPNSRVLLRIEPQIDFTNCKVVEDVFQNHVDILVSYPIEFIRERTMTKEDIFGKAFLREQDPMFKKVLELEQKNKN